MQELGDNRPVWILGLLFIRSRQLRAEGQVGSTQKLQDKAMQAIPQIDVLSLRSEMLVFAWRALEAAWVEAIRRYFSGLIEVKNRKEKSSCGGRVDRPL